MTQTPEQIAAGLTKAQREMWRGRLMIWVPRQQRAKGLTNGQHVIGTSHRLKVRRKQAQPNRPGNPG